MAIVGDELRIWYGAPSNPSLAFAPVTAAELQKIERAAAVGDDELAGKLWGTTLNMAGGALRRRRSAL